MKELLLYLFEHRTLSRERAKEALLAIGEGKYNEHELSAFMSVFLMRNITLEEMAGFKDALLELCVKINFGATQSIDIVGTGGDGRNTFNISTITCFIVAAAGQPVTKHGSFGSSSASGASNFMSALGYQFKTDPSLLANELAETNLCFLHAPIFHPALKTVAPIRKNLRVRTVFNLLGPLVNPAEPAFQMIGAYNIEIVRMYNYLLQSENRKYAIVHSMDGYDEVSLTSEVKVVSHKEEKMISPSAFSSVAVNHASLFGGESVEQAAKIGYAILMGEGTQQQNAVVIANAALALMTAEQYNDLPTALEAAADALHSGKVKQTMNRLIQLQNKL
jgi:anthranilate phosphoribosyltransferase